MQAVILAAGYGTRMGTLTEQVPKPLLNVGNKNLLQHKIDNLPESCTEVIIVIGYMGEKIKEFFGTHYNGKIIRYIEDETVTGTAHALWQAKDILTGRFLVMMGDDIYSKQSFLEASKHDVSIVCKIATTTEGGSRITTNPEGNLENFVTHETYKLTHNDGGLIFTGLYSLTPEIFSYTPVKLKTKEEWGLPQTLLSAIPHIQPKIIQTDFWISISSPDDLLHAEKLLTTH